MAAFYNPQQVLKGMQAGEGSVLNASLLFAAPAESAGSGGFVLAAASVAGEPLADVVIFGDAHQILDRAQGGSDRIVGGALSASNYLVGDGMEMYGRSAGGADCISGGMRGEVNTIIGDGYLMMGFSRGGPDVIDGALGGMVGNYYGDAVSMKQSARGGNDQIAVQPGGSRHVIVGDAYTMLDRSRGGSDRLTGAADIIRSGENNFNKLYGDAVEAFGKVSCGNDWLTAGDRSLNYLVGDAMEVGPGVRLGSDRLVAGSGEDHLWGDGMTVAKKVKRGSDVFVFTQNNGVDRIYDFEPRRDKIEFMGVEGVRTYADVRERVTFDSMGALIDLGVGHTVYLNQVQRLSAECFQFSLQ